MSQSKKIFTFDDIVNIEDRSLQKILYEIDDSELAKALVSAGTEVLNKVLSNVSKRRAARIKRYIEGGHGGDKSSQKETRRKIISIIQYFDDIGDLVTSGNFCFPDDSEVKSLVEHIEEACDSGKLYLNYYGIDKISEEYVREAFAAFKNRHDELSRIKSFYVKGYLLSSVAPLIEKGNIEELCIKDLTELPAWICNVNSVRRLSIEDSKITTLLFLIFKIHLLNIYPAA